jgi:hypothetical protein
MKKLKWWGVSTFIGLLIGVVIWWLTGEDPRDELNKSAAFVYRDQGVLYWFEFNSRIGKVEGKLHKKVIIEEIGREPLLEEKDYPITGKKTDKGYELQIKDHKEIRRFDAWFSEKNLSVQEQGESDVKIYQAVGEEKLGQYENELQQEWENVLYYAEEKEKNRKRKFLSDLKGVYGYLYSSAKERFQVFLKIDEAFEQGEAVGTLLVMEDTGNENNPYQEVRYALNGITDGLMVEFFTTVDGQGTKLKGNFIEATIGLDMSFWMADKKLRFKAVTEEEFNQSYEEYKLKAQK